MAPERPSVSEARTGAGAAVRSRNATKATLNATLEAMLAKIRQRVDPDYEQLYRCGGGCEDTGWVVIDVGKLGKAPTVRRCTRCGGRPPKSETGARGGSFS